jgi:glutamate-1-semialdehyde 2,1-aminomutase
VSAPAAAAALADRGRLHALIAAERERFAAGRPRSRALHERAARSLLSGVPMPWMAKAVGGHPIYLASAAGSRVTDADGHEYVDLSLGDTGAMAGHSPAPVLAALRSRAEEHGGITTMMPTEDGLVVGEELRRRFGMPAWQFTLTATDANRFALRMLRQIQKRPKVLVFNWCYHGSVDETVCVLEDGAVRPKPGNVGAPVEPSQTTRVAEFNDVASVERELAHGDVACVLAEPALTNCGIVLPEPGFWEAVRELCDATGTLLILDETHTFSAGPGGCTRAWDLRPDVVTIGKALASGVPIGAYGLSREVADRVAADEEGDYLDWGGVGGTLAGNALSLAAARATLTEVLTDAAFEHMRATAARYAGGVRAAIHRHGLPWSIVELGARAEYHFVAPTPRTGQEARDAIDEPLDDFLHLFMLNRGIVMTPFHNMALMAPTTTAEDVDRHTAVFDEALATLTAPG